MLPWAAGLAKLGQASPTGLIINPRYPRYHRPKFHAEFGVAKEESDGPWVGLPQPPVSTPPMSPVPHPYDFPMGGVSTPEKYGSGKVRGQSVDITTKGPDHSVEVWANFVPNVAERVGFEPTMKLPPYRFSRPALSSAQPSLHNQPAYPRRHWVSR